MVLVSCCAFAVLGFAVFSRVCPWVSVTRVFQQQAGEVGKVIAP